METQRATLVVTKQSAISEEKVTSRGKTQTVYVVVKNSPFQMTIALQNCFVNLKQLAFDIILIYDMPDYTKEVAYVSTKPVDYKPCINEIGDEISFDAKISALSSQHEDTFFRLKITIWDPNNTKFSPLSTLSHPIKVISKPINQRKPRKKATPTPTLTATPRRSKSAKTPISQSPPEQKDSPLLVEHGPPEIPQVLHGPGSMEVLHKIEYQQQETLNLLHQLISRSQAHQDNQQPSKRQKLEHSQHNSLNSSMGMLQGVNSTLPNDSNPNPMNNDEIGHVYLHPNHFVYQNPTSPSLEFESSFSIMLRSYGQMSAEEKAETIRKIFRTLPARDSEQLEELVDILETAGLKSTRPIAPSYPYPYVNLSEMKNGLETHGNHNVGLNNHLMTMQMGNESMGMEPLDCPYRSDMLRVDRFYSDVFF